MAPTGVMHRNLPTPHLLHSDLLKLLPPQTAVSLPTYQAANTRPCNMRSIYIYVVSTPKPTVCLLLICFIYNMIVGAGATLVTAWTFAHHIHISAIIMEWNYGISWGKIRTVNTASWLKWWFVICVVEVPSWNIGHNTDHFGRVIMIFLNPS